MLVQRIARFAGPRASGTHGRCRAQESTVWCFQPPLASGLVWLGTGPRRGLSRLGYPGSPGGRPASLTFSTCRSIRSMYTRPTATVPSSATLPFPLLLSMYRTRAVPFLLLPPFVVVLCFFSRAKYTGCPRFFLFGLFTVWAGLGTTSWAISSFLGPMVDCCVAAVCSRSSPSSRCGVAGHSGHSMSGLSTLTRLHVPFARYGHGVRPGARTPSG